MAERRVRKKLGTAPLVAPTEGQIIEQLEKFLNGFFGVNNIKVEEYKGKDADLDKCYTPLGRPNDNLPKEIEETMKEAPDIEKLRQEASQVLLSGILPPNNLLVEVRNLLIKMIAIHFDAKHKTNIRNCKTLYYIDIYNKPREVKRSDFSKEEWNCNICYNPVFRSKAELITAQKLTAPLHKRIKEYVRK